MAIQALLADPASGFTSADQLQPAPSAAAAAVVADDEDADDDEGGGEEAEDGDNASVTTSGKKKKSSVVQHPAVYTKMIQLSNAVDVPEWDLIERAYVDKFNRLLAVDLVRSSMTRDEAFGEAMTDERYELLFARETGRYDGPIDRLEMTMLDAQRERAEKNIKNLQRKDLKNEAALWEQSKQERMSRMHKQRLDAIDSLQRKRRATLDFILKDRRENADSTSDLKRKEQSDIRRERSRLRTEKDRLEQLLKRSRDPEEQQRLRGQIAELEEQIENLNEREKTVVQQAKEAEAAAKADEREARFKESLAELAGKLVDESVRVAAAALGLDRHKKTLQNKFDRAAEAVGGMPTPEDMKKIDDIAPQPTYKRSRQENGIEKAKRGEEDVVISEDRERWEIAATRMSREQHDLMFLDEAEVKMQMAEWTSYLAQSAASGSGSGSGASAMEVAPVSANLKITSVNGHLRYNGHHFSHIDIDHAASIGVNPTESLADRAINSAEPISIDELITAPVVVFNKPYARVVLTEHMLSLRRQQINAVANNSNAEFVNVAHSLGDFDETPAGREKLMAIVNKLLPFYESMLKYYHTMMGVKTPDDGGRRERRQGAGRACTRQQGGRGEDLAHQSDQAAANQAGTGEGRLHARGSAPDSIQRRPYSRAAVLASTLRTPAADRRAATRWKVGGRAAHRQSCQADRHADAVLGGPQQDGAALGAAAEAQAARLAQHQPGEEVGQAQRARDVGGAGVAGRCVRRTGAGQAHLCRGHSNQRDR